ncbi:MAG: HupE/UreJ family protein, partial [Gemmatimonadota bacterium]
FLIPVTILATCVENLVAYARKSSDRRRRLRAVLAGLFGLVHGAGFANYLKALFVDRIAVPLLGFNLGIEAGQLVILFAAGIMFLAMDRVLRRIPRVDAAAFRVRVMAVSMVVALFATRMVIERSVW